MEDPLLRSVYLCDKVVLLGDSGVGKTSIFNSFCDGRNSSGEPLGEYRKVWKAKDGKVVAITLFDIPGTTVLGSPGHTPPSIFTGDKAVLLVYSINDLDSYLSIPSWLNEVISRSRNTEIVIGLVGNKVDLESERTVSLEQAKEFARQNLIPDDLVFEISAQDDTNIQQMFDTIADKISMNYSKYPSTTKISSTTSKSNCC